MERLNLALFQTTLKTVPPKEYHWKEEDRSSLNMLDVYVVYIQIMSCFKFIVTIVMSWGSRKRVRAEYTQSMSRNLSIVVKQDRKINTIGSCYTHTCVVKM